MSQSAFFGYKLFLTALVAGLLLSSCAEDGIIDESPRVTIPESQELITATLYGRVLDANGSPLGMAEVVYHNGISPVMVLSETDGSFLIEEVQNKGRAAFLSVTSSGKFEAFRKFSILPGRYNYTEIQMKEYEIIGSVSSSEGGSLSLNTGAAIKLPANGIVQSTGEPYTGEVSVAMAWIDPSSDNLSREMVGDLSGIDSEGNIRSLSTFGMLQVELIGTQGQLLNLGAEQVAELRFPIPPSMSNQTEPSIPLWSYEELIGTWIQEGNAILDGGFYVGEVGHFSSWNVDFMTDPIALEGEIILKSDDKSTVASYFQIFVCSDKIGKKGGWVCEDGSFRFYNFPKEQEFYLKVLDKCGDIIYKESYGPYTEDTDIGKIEVINSQSTSKIFGNLVDCNGMPVTNGAISVLQGDRSTSFPVDELGQFEFGFDFCDDKSATLIAIDQTARLSAIAALPASKEVIEVSDIKVCDELTDYIAISIDGAAERLLTPNIFVFVDGNSTSDSTDKQIIKILFEREDSIREERFALYFHHPDSGKENIGFKLEYYDDKINCKVSDATMFEVSLTEFGLKSGDFIAGTFTGTFECLDWNDQGKATEKTFSGSFKVPIR